MRRVYKSEADPYGLLAFLTAVLFTLIYVCMVCLTHFMGGGLR